MKNCMVVLLSIVLAGCLGNAPKMDPTLDDMLRQFEVTVRWGDLRNMYAFIRPAPDETMRMAEGLENIRVISYETVSAPRELRPGRWAQSVAIEYVHQDRQVVTGLMDHQIWEQDPVSEQWHRLPPLPTFR